MGRVTGEKQEWGRAALSGVAPSDSRLQPRSEDLESHKSLTLCCDLHSGSGTDLSRPQPVTQSPLPADGLGFLLPKGNQTCQ
jgi:hypothetical protein